MVFTMNQLPWCLTVNQKGILSLSRQHNICTAGDWELFLEFHLNNEETSNANKYKFANVAIEEKELNKFSSSKSSSSTTTFSSCGIGWDGGNILDSSDSHTTTGECSESRLSTGTRLLGTNTTLSSKLDVKSVDLKFLASVDDIDSGLHGWRILKILLLMMFFNIWNQDLFLRVNFKKLNTHCLWKFAEKGLNAWNKIIYQRKEKILLCQPWPSYLR